MALAELAWAAVMGIVVVDAGHDVAQPDGLVVLERRFALLLELAGSVAQAELAGQQVPVGAVANDDPDHHIPQAS